jgi:uncharacterized protein
MSAEPARVGRAWMMTKSGRAFWPLQPHVGEPAISDIAHALAHICRYGGHTTRFYSVAEHSFHVWNAVRAVEPDAGLEALLHDATEAYIGDLIWPLKQDVGFAHEFKRAEARLARVIAGTFGTRYPYPPIVKRMDTAILVNEREQAMPPAREAAADWGRKEWGEPIAGLTLEFWSPTSARNAFMEAFQGEIRLRAERLRIEGSDPSRWREDREALS